MELSMAEFLERASTGRIFKVSFVKRSNQEERTMVCRTGVRKGTVGKSIGYDPEAKRLLSVYDMQAKGFRMVNLEEPLTAKIDGCRLTWDRRRGRWVEASR